jgi:hypothetical protein
MAQSALVCALALVLLLHPQLGALLRESDQLALRQWLVVHPVAIGW